MCFGEEAVAAAEAALMAVAAAAAVVKTAGPLVALEVKESMPRRAVRIFSDERGSPSHSLPGQRHECFFGFEEVCSKLSLPSRSARLATHRASHFLSARPRFGSLCFAHPRTPTRPRPLIFVYRFPFLFSFSFCACCAADKR
jgi:hypothetical protein